MVSGVGEVAVPTGESVDFIPPRLAANAMPGLSPLGRAQRAIPGIRRSEPQDCHPVRRSSHCGGVVCELGGPVPHTPTDFSFPEWWVSEARVMYICIERSSAGAARLFCLDGCRYSCKSRTIRRPQQTVI